MRRGRPQIGSIGLVGLDHVGITVPDIDQAIEWFEGVLGAAAPLTVGPIAADVSLADALGIAASASIDRITMLRIGQSAGIELLQYTAPDGQRQDMPSNSDWTGHHIAFYVDDMDAAVEYMEGKDVDRMPGGPASATEGPAAGGAIQYFRTPWGGYLEFISYPQGVDEECRRSEGPWSPKLNRKESEATKVPGLLGIDHVGITVPNVELAAVWLEEKLGFVELSRFGPVEDPDGDLMRRLLDVNPRAVIEQIRVLACGNGPSIELFQYAAPDQDRTPRVNSDWGAHHLGFFVHDIDEAIATLQDRSGSRRGGPMRTTAGPAAGREVNYFSTPLATDVELISYPEGIEYGADAPVPLWDPRDNRPL